MSFYVLLLRQVGSLIRTRGGDAVAVQQIAYLHENIRFHLSQRPLTAGKEAHRMTFFTVGAII
jgi:hypothetical protein